MQSEIFFALNTARGELVADLGRRVPLYKCLQKIWAMPTSDQVHFVELEFKGDCAWSTERRSIGWCLIDSH